jgi:formylglycine-generating enzyme required for sulfatase activity
MIRAHPAITLSLLLMVAGPVTAEGEQKPVDAEQVESLRLAIGHLAKTYPDRYQRGTEWLARLAALREPSALENLRKEALLAHPALAGARLLVIRRAPRQLGLPANWAGNSCLPRSGYDNEIALLAMDGTLQTLFRPGNGRFVGDVDLDFDGSRLMFSMPDEAGVWQIFVLRADGTGLTQLPLVDAPDVDNYDACFLPDGDIMFSSTAPFVGVPCVTGASHVANLFRWHRKDGSIRRLTFDQEHNWCPTVLDDGRLLYQRWEYSDLPHFVSRMLFTMHPDGTNQREFYGSGSYWPNSLFYARPAPGAPGRFAAIVSGHHGAARIGELVVFDTARGSHEAQGAVQRIPGRGRPVEPVILDNLVDKSWPKFLHPWPIDASFMLVACQPNPSARWGIYLADVFDNLVLLKEDATHALLEPVPLRPRPRPPSLPDNIKPGRQDATAAITDIYAGPGLKDVPRGTVRNLRLFTYHFAYHGMGGQTNRVGLDGPWDIKRIIGTVPVEPDGSAHFRLPANTPVSIQPLDADGKAVQLMRSWMTAMPGEKISCSGCHEQPGAVSPASQPAALTREPSEIKPWYGPVRGFSFRREVQPVLDRYCVSCHPEFKDGPEVVVKGCRFPPAYLALRAFVRGHTMESDMHLLNPCEFHADTTFLVQLLRAGHGKVKLDREAWDRLITWIDLNTPAHGTWTEIVGAQKVDHQRDRRREMLRRYANLDEDPEAILPTTIRMDGPPVAAWKPPSSSPPPPSLTVNPGVVERTTIDLGGVPLELARIPAAEPFWIGTREVTNRQFAVFDPTHDSGIETGDFLQFSTRERGYPVNGSDQPVVRISWHQAVSFTRWLSRRTGRNITLPTGTQWEFACRAGAATSLWWGEPDADFSQLANLADARFRQVDTFGWNLPSGAVPPWRPAATKINDQFRVTAPAGSFQPNPWGLHDMHGNAAEWTLDETPEGRKLVRGGSFADRPQWARAATIRHYPPWQRVYDTGFRVVIIPDPSGKGTSP